jgi:hypothetical protein
LRSADVQYFVARFSAAKPNGSSSAVMRSYAGSRSMIAAMRSSTMKPIAQT